MKGWTHDRSPEWFVASVPFSIGWTLKLAAMDLVRSQSIADLLTRVSLALLAASTALLWPRHRWFSALAGLLTLGLAVSGPEEVRPRSAGHVALAVGMIAFVILAITLGLAQRFRARAVRPAATR